MIYLKIFSWIKGIGEISVLSAYKISKKIVWQIKSPMKTKIPLLADN
jgi:hypothetical protein